MKKGMLPFFLLSFFMIAPALPLAASEIGKEVEVTFLGQSAFKIVSPKGVVIYIDPFLSANPRTPAEMKIVEKADLILVTHGHGDHLGDTLAIAEKTNARIVVMPELGRHLTRKGAKNVMGMNKGEPMPPTAWPSRWFMRCTAPA